ncbi:hypothetical protein BS17DRAFT_820906 [Gyrodon lividus]|nr:hypothetical protein BS17DRAFT_820906 [Gyrodon lividus]
MSHPAEARDARLMGPTGCAYRRPRVPRQRAELTVVSAASLMPAPLPLNASPGNHPGVRG